MSNGKVFADIAGSYDRINRILSLGQDQAWRQRAVSMLPSGRLLDLGAGTGAANPILGRFDVVALDPAPEMLAHNTAPSRVVAVGESLPFASDTFDAAFSAYVVRNLDSLDGALGEIHRILRPGGRVGIVDLSRPSTVGKARLHRAGTAVVLPTVGALARAGAEYKYLHRSLDKLAPPEELYAHTPFEVVAMWRMGPLGFVYGVVLEKRR
ncbi:MAG: class I SAM-dependent methyltransferase [bacterium]|nr:class I SAM-dependent methyltransferase [bacterium]